MRAAATGAIALLLIAITGAAQAAGRKAQTGVKTSDPGYVVSLDVPVPVGDLGGAGRLIRENLDLLSDAAIAEGFTPVGKGRVVIQLNLQTPPQGAITVSLQQFILEEPSEEDLQVERDFALLCVPAERVAYTYHRGTLEELQGTFVRLMQWMIGEGLDPNGFPMAIAYSIPATGLPEVYEVQMPVK
jgi:hypothetical protein